MKLLYIKSPSAGVHYHRLELPFYLLANDGMNVTESNIYRMHDDEYDVVVFNRLPYYQPLTTIVRLQSKGVKVIVDLDDYWERPIYNSNYSVYESEYKDEILKALKIANVVWVSTPELQDRLKKIQIESVLVPNALCYDEPQFNRTEIDHPLSFGWVGGGEHQIDFRKLIEPFKHRFKALPVIGGATTTKEGELSRYHQFLGQVLAGGNPSKCKYYLATDVNNYGHLYNYLDIVVLPSHDDVFSRCKSNLKLLEAGSHKLPVITNGVVYKEVNNKIGIRVSSDREWVKGMNRLIESKRMRAELGEALHDYTKTKYDIKKINTIRKQSIEL